MTQEELKNLLQAEVKVTRKLFEVFDNRYLILEFEDGSVMDVTVDLEDSNRPLLMDRYESMEDHEAYFAVPREEFENPFSEAEIELLKTIPGIKNIYGGKA
jgi:hypothetical protein